MSRAPLSPAAIAELEEVGVQAHDQIAAIVGGVVPAVALTALSSVVGSYAARLIALEIFPDDDAGTALLSIFDRQVRESLALHLPAFREIFERELAAEQAAAAAEGKLN